MRRNKRIEIFRGNVKEFKAEVCLIAPFQALERPGFIRILGIEGQEKKHRAYMLSQRALIDFEEDALNFTTLPSEVPIEICYEEQKIPIDKGCVLAMDTDQNLCFLIHEDVPLKQMLSILNRAATRLIRLDVP